MISNSAALAGISPGLRNPLLSEYGHIVQNYLDGRWSPSELSGGRFCEIVYTILDGFASGNYAAAPRKPANFVSACRDLENRTNVPRSFQILIPRILPALYEIRNNRGVGHVGGDVDPNHMDATAVLSMSSWVLAELVRVFHSLSPEDAQQFVDSLVERRIPLVWKSADMRRVLDPSLSLKDQVLLLLSSSSRAVMTVEVFEWTDYDNRTYFFAVLRKLHNERLVELSKDESTVEILPPGARHVEKLLREQMTTH